MFLGHPFGSVSAESRQGLVSVAITLRPAAAEVGVLLWLKFKYPKNGFPFNICSDHHPWECQGQSYVSVGLLSISMYI